MIDTTAVRSERDRLYALVTIARLRRDEQRLADEQVQARKQADTLAREVSRYEAAEGRRWL